HRDTQHARRQFRCKAFIVAVPDDPGEVAKVAEALASKGINITSVAGWGWQGQGAIALTTGDDDGARAALNGVGQMVRELDVITATLDDRPGTLAALTRKLADAGINL